MRVEIGTVAVEREHQQQLDIHPRRRNSLCGKSSNSGGKDLLELHDINSRKPPRSLPTQLRKTSYYPQTKSIAEHLVLMVKPFSKKFNLQCIVGGRMIRSS